MSRTTSRRARRASVSLLTAAIGLGLTAPALAQVPTSPVGLYGAQDPTYDGAYRQSLVLLALAAAGIDDPDGTAWLRDQQCADGGWTAYRDNTSQPCPATNLGTFAGEDSNSTALAVLALTAQGVDLKVDPEPFLKSLQNADGGVGYLDGLDTDANSTALVLHAVLALEDDPTSAEWTAATGNLQSALLALQLLCAADEADRGGWAAFGSADVLATAQAVPAAAGRTYFLGPDAPVADDEPTLDCSGTPTPPDAATAADLGAGWLARKVNEEGFVPGPGGAPNYGLTSYAVIAFQAAGVGGLAYDAALAYLAAHVDDAVVDGDGDDKPGALALLILGAIGADLDPTDFGGDNLLERLAATQRLQAEPTEEPEPSEEPEPTDDGEAPTVVATLQPGLAPTLVATGGFGTKPWDEVGIAVFGFGLIGYGLLFLAGARWAAHRTRPRHHL